MKKYIFIIIFGIGLSISAQAQYFFGVKGGIGLNMQKWNSFERDILFTPLIDLYVESHDDPINKVYSSLGFHTRGSAIRGFGFQSFNSYRFNNLSLEVGFKQMLSVSKKYNPYYMLAGRLEYTVSTNLGGTSTQFSVLNLVDDNFVNKFNYGLTIGGGFEFNWDDTKVVFIEASINPDASKQYDQPTTAVINNPFPSTFNPGPITIRPQEVRNVSVEIKVGIKFLRGYWEEDDYQQASVY